MALKSWLASLKTDVSTVSGVQAPIYAGWGRYVTESADVSDVSGSDGLAISDTADTSVESQTYQAQPAWALACTCDTADTAGEINGEVQTAETTSSLAQSEPKRLFRKCGTWLNGTEPMAAQAYHAHHFSCPICIAAGRGARYEQRCHIGTALWHEYSHSQLALTRTLNLEVLKAPL
jgi:hypothetical protein